MEMERDERTETLRVFRKYGLSLEHFAGTDVEFVCHALNLFLSVCGHGVVLNNSAVKLGEKVRAAEAIVLALEDTGCRTGLKPHQISGLDWKAIRNVAEYVVRGLFCSPRYYLD